MPKTLKDLLPELDVQEPLEVDGFQVFGLRSKNGGGLKYATLDEATAEDQLEVTEISESGSVPNLKVLNRGDSMVFLMAGEELVGAKQNRVLNVSIMVRPKSEMPIPVSCVEAGRWAYRSSRFRSAGTSSHSKLRAQMLKQVSTSYQTLGRPTSDQGAVWGEVNRKLQSMGSRSDSSELHQAYRDSEKRLKNIHAQTPAPEGCSGAVFAFGGRIIGADLFDRPSTLTKLWPKLLRSYAIDAFEEKRDVGPKSRDDVRAWLNSAAQAEVKSFKSPGLGEDFRLEGKDLVGACLSVDNHAVHVEMLSEAEQRPE